MIDDEQRRALAQCCRQPGRRVISPPCDWCPQTVENPALQGYYLSDESAWHFIADLLEKGHEVEQIALEIPKGKAGYVLKYNHPSGRQLYIKLMFLKNGVAGRSFHFSVVTPDQPATSRRGP